MPLSLADVLSAQAGGGPVYEGGPDANVTLGGVLSAVGLGGPSWLDAARKQTGADIAAYQRGGVPEMMADTGQTQELAGGFGGTTTPAKGIRAYHGSPYDFEKFDISKIGTGEGFQKYGHGLYFAENPSVANDYRNRLGRNYAWSDASEINSLLPKQYQGSTDSARRIISEVEKSPNPNDFLKEYDIHPSLVPAYQKAIDIVGGKGRMYEVNINAEPGQFLNWDAPLSQQPQALQDIVASGPPRLSGNDIKRGQLSAPSGEDIYRRLATNAQRGPEWAPQTPYGQHFATNQLNEAGIPGIRYLDQGSRNAAMLYIEPHVFNNGEQGFKVNGPKGDRLFDTHQEAQAFIDAHNTGATSNYVVFNPEIVDILKKYGLAGLTMGGVLSAAGQEPAPSQ